MKRKILLIFAVTLTMILSGCGMTPEEIDTALTGIEASYQNGTYEQAQTDVHELDKSYKKMSDEQKTKFGELRSSVEYAAANVTAINEGLNNAQSFRDQKMYYEASAELEKLAAAYTLPPAEQAKYNEMKTAVDTSISQWKVTEALQNVEATLNGGDYNSASAALANIDTASLTEEQNQKYQTLQSGIVSAKAKAEAEAKAKAEAERKKAKEKEIVQREKEVLEVPNDLDVTYVLGDEYYWQAGQLYLRSIAFYHNGKMVACCDFDIDTGNSVRNIHIYDGLEY